VAITNNWSRSENDSNSTNTMVTAGHVYLVNELGGHGSEITNPYCICWPTLSTRCCINQFSL